ncbi:MAG TPA: penicillin-binding transpeptidase domain-containing protein [Polyangiaceae bacterium]|nr:penicillin-binding transpeptidase domain-containing protein [Polyangiaceae bacterium]
MVPRSESRSTAWTLGSVVAVVLALLGALPEPARGASIEPPEPNLDELRFVGDVATAPTLDGGVAELTLDAGLQRAAERLLAAAHPDSGAIVAIDPTHGQVVAWAGIRAGVPSPSVVTTTLAPAASLFKIVTTTALLEKHVDPNRTVCVEGGSSGIFAEHLHRPTSGRALCGPFREALGRSRNAVFAQLVTRFLHKDDILRTAERFGFNGNVALDVPAIFGTLTMPDGELPVARAATGFVGSRLSPVGAADLATIVATKGRLLRLHLVKRAGGFEPPKRRRFAGRVMDEETARRLARMMEVTVHTGTSVGAFTDEAGKSYLGDVRAAGKTGTLQPDDDDPTTSWFVGFAPSRRPRLVLSVLLENGPVWRRKANEVGRDLFRVYFASRGYRGVTMPDGI